MIYIIFVYAAVVVAMAAGFTIFLFLNPERWSRSLLAKYLVINATAAAGIAFSVHYALPDAKPSPLENALPPEWRQAVLPSSNTANQWIDHFTPEEDEAARSESQILQAVKTNTAVDGYVTVREGDVDALKRTLEQQITISGGHVVSTEGAKVLAAIPASYVPCLEKIAALEPSKQPTDGYRQFALSAVSDRTPCPLRNGDAVDRTVRIDIKEKPVGLMLDQDDAIAAALMYFIIIPLYLVSMLTALDLPSPPQRLTRRG